MKRAILPITALVALAASGCGPESSHATSNDIEEVVVPAGKADGAMFPHGTYRHSAPSTSSTRELSLLVLRFDNSFHAESIVNCVSAPCPPLAFHGEFDFTTFGNRRFIRLWRGDDSFERYALSLGLEGELILSYAPEFDSEYPSFLLQPDPIAWCETPVDCEMQLFSPDSPGGFTCNDHTCSHEACEPVTCKMYCTNGFVVDHNGCEICECAPSPGCEPMTCKMYCANGFVVDDNGCEICECAPSPGCEPMTCKMYCANGFVVDDNGCEICECAD